MKHLELHILQSVPVACLNRDELGMPKTAYFGGVQRARVSSQSWKRAIRDYAVELLPAYYQGKRTLYMHSQLKDKLIELGLDEAKSHEGAEAIIKKLAGKDSEKKDNHIRSKTIYFCSPNEIEILAKNYAETGKVKGVKASELNDAADISLFGRMVANDPSLKVEAASMFSHALSVHQVDNEADFFVAVDDAKPNDLDDVGSSMMGSLDYISATYYRFSALNLDMLADEGHLGSLEKSERQSIVKVFVEATICAIPAARKNTMNANTLPSYVLGVIREKGHPIQLVNAFETPIFSKEGYAKSAQEKMLNEYSKLKKTWALDEAWVGSVTDLGLSTFLEQLNGYVS